MDADEFFEMVAAIQAPVTSAQLLNNTLAEAETINNNEAIRACKALVLFFDKKRKEEQNGN